MSNISQVSDFSEPLADFIAPEGNPGFSRNIALGLQHVFAMFGATVLGPLLMGFDPNTALLFSGIATLIFYAITDRKVPSYLGSSFAYISAVNAATGYSGVGVNQNAPIALGGIFVSGCLYCIIAIFVRITGTLLVNALFPPTVTGAIVGVIGLNLARIAVQEVGSSPSDALVAIVTVLIVVTLAVYPHGFLRRIPLLVGAIAGDIIYLLIHNVFKLGKPLDFSKLEAAPWIGPPHLQVPHFDITAISLIAPVVIILVAENLGHVKAIGGMMHRNLDPLLWRAFMGDGIATIVSSLGGGTGVTTYAENMGIMRITRNFSSVTLLFAAVFAIVLSLSPKFGALLSTIPSPVLGGLSIMMFGIIAATAGSIWQQGRNTGKVDFDDIRTLIVVGVTLVVGAGDFTITFGRFSLGGIVTATITAVSLYHLTRIGQSLLPQDEIDGNSPYKS